MPTPRQPSFFESTTHGSGVDPAGAAAAGTIRPTTLPLRRDQLLAWQQRVQDHQAPLFASPPASDQQGSLLPAQRRGLPQLWQGTAIPLA